MWKFVLPVLLELIWQTHGSVLEEEMVQLKAQMKSFVGELHAVKIELELTRKENHLLKQRVDELTKEGEYVSKQHDTTKGSEYYEDNTGDGKTITEDNSKAVKQRIYRDHSRLSTTNHVPNDQDTDSMNQIARQRRLLLQTASTVAPRTQKVAFSVGLTHPVQLGHNQDVKYDKVLTNVGNAYDSRHGHFTAPVKGLYLFSISTLNQSGQSVYLEIVKNAQRLAIIYMHSTDRSIGSETTVTVLEKGDMVWVRHTMGGTPTIDSYPDQWFNTFTGTIIFEI